MSLAPQPSSPSQVNHFFITVHWVKSMLTLCEGMLGHLQECGQPTMRTSLKKTFYCPAFSSQSPSPTYARKEKYCSLIASSGQVKLDCECGAVKAMMVTCYIISRNTLEKMPFIQANENSYVASMLWELLGKSYKVYNKNRWTRKNCDLSPELAIFIVSL